MWGGEIIAIGSELLLGGRQDTNSLFLSEELAALGVEVRWKTVVGDEEADIMEALRTAVRRAELVVLTGGLGPTSDDRTRQAVARVTNRPLRRHADAMKRVSARLAAWGRTASAAQLRQALIPAGAAVLANPIGSAPGFALVWKSCHIIALPGVPAEAHAMFSKEASPLIAAWLGPAARVRIERRLLHTFGLPEADLEARVAPLVAACRGVRLGLLASPLGVTVSLQARGSQAPVAALDRVVGAVRATLGELVYAEGTETMEEVVGRALAAMKLTIAVAESCTGGLIGHRLTQVPGSSAYLDRVLVCYSNEAKMDLLGVPKALLARHGAVSSEVAAAMARGVRERSHTDIGLSVTGIAGPAGGTEHKPVGLVYAGFDAEGTGMLVKAFQFHGPRDAIKLRASQAALNLLRQWVPLARPARS